MALKLIWSLTPVRWDALLFVWSLAVPVSLLAVLAAYQAGHRPDRRMQRWAIVGCVIVSLAMVVVTLLRRWPGVLQLGLSCLALVSACVLVGRRWDVLMMQGVTKGMGVVRWWSRGLALYLVLLFLWLYFSYSTVPSTQDGRWERAAQERLARLGWALDQYHDRYGCYPPAAVPGPDGTLWHSWCTLLLPELGARDVYAAYNFEHPYNHLANQTAVCQVAEAFLIPGESGQRDPNGWGLTHWAGVCDQGALFDLARISDPPRRDDIQDSLAETLIIGPITSAPAPWAKPGDGATVRPLSWGFRCTWSSWRWQPRVKGFSGAFPGGVMFLTADRSELGMIRQDIPEELSLSQRRALTTIAGGEENRLEE